MKVLFLHLSDMHFVSDSSYTKKDCEEIANAVAAKIICPISMIFLVLSGDIAFSGGAEEYNEAEKFVGELQASILGKVKIDKEKIKVLLVPGNHDRQYPEDRPDREDYESVLSRRKDEELKTYHKSILSHQNYAPAVSSAVTTISQTRMCRSQNLGCRCPQKEIALAKI